MNMSPTIIVIIVVAVVIAIGLGVFIATKTSKDRGQKLEELAGELQMKFVSAKYASGIVGEHKGRQVVLLLAMHDAPTSHIVTSNIEVYMETGIASSGTDPQVPEGMRVADGDKILKGSGLDLVLLEHQGQGWKNKYIIAAPKHPTKESIQETMDQMASSIK